MTGKLLKLWLVVWGCVAFLPGSSWAQEPPKSGPPRLLLTTGGPVAAVRGLAFAPTSDRLFSAGGDKLARIWDIERVGPQKQVRATLAGRLHWEVARGTRGHIYAMAVSPSGQRLAMGGMCARDANGHIVIYDTGLSDIDQVLDGHRQTVVSLSFSPDGRRLASVSIDGEARIWTMGDWQSVTVRKPSARFTDPQPALFLSDSVLAVATPDPDPGSSDWRVVLHDVFDKEDPARPRLLARRHAWRVMSLARDAGSDAWASSDAAGNVYLWKGTKGASPELLCRGRVADCLAFVPGGRLLFTTRQDANKQSVLEMWDVRRKVRIDQTVLATGQDSYACAASPDGNYAVAYSPANSELMLFTLNDGNGQPLAKPLSTQAVTRLRGSGQRIWKVAFDARAGYRLGLGMRPREAARQAFGDYGDVDWVFDPIRGRLVAAQPQNDAWRSHTDGSDGWSVTPGQGGSVLVLSHGGTERGRIDLDPVYQGRAKSYCWLADANGRTYGLAVGTDKQNGVFAYALPEAGKCRLLRYFRDHRGWVTSLSLSSDGKYLASASVDQTVDIWSLEGILAQDGAFKQEAAWGAVFQPHAEEGGYLLVTSLSKAGIGARRGLKVGDKIIRVWHVEDAEEQKITDPAEMLQALESKPIWQTVVLSVLEGDDTKRILLVPAWEPLLTLFVARNAEWAAWTPQGYYHASVEGDEMFGWQINRDWNLRPLFYRADRFRRQLEQPEVIRRLLRAGNLPDALEAVLGSVPPDVQDRVSSVSATLPNLRIVQPRDNARIGRGEPIDLVAKADFPSRQATEDYKLRCYVNQVPMDDPAQEIVGQTATYRWQMPPVDEYNRVEVMAVHEEDRADSPYSDAAVHVRAELAQREPPRLHLVAFAAEDYNGDEIRLDYAVDDAKSFLEALRKGAGRYYQLGAVVTLTDHQINRRSVDATITDLRVQLGDVRPQDLLITFIAGHGIAQGREYYFLPPDPELTDVKASLIERVGVPWQMLRRLAAVPCRKLFLLDTCHSGNALLLATDPLYHQKQAVRPIKRTQSVVVSATDVGQNSYEEQSLQHGLFTYSLLKALDGSADGYYMEGAPSPGPDGTVDLAETVYYVVQEVPKLAQRLGGRDQQPKVAPADLWYFPIVQYRE